MGVKPFFSYFGGKWTLAPRYPKPEHGTIVEPFAGSAGYAIRYPDREVILVERAPVIEGDYSAAPDVEATWFVDPPYIGSRHHYLARVDSLRSLSTWCRTRRGLTIVCEQDGAEWLPFTPFRAAKSISRGSYGEVVCIQRDAVNTPSE